MPSDAKLDCKDSITKICIRAPNLIPTVKNNKYYIDEALFSRILSTVWVLLTVLA